MTRTPRLGFVGLGWIGRQRMQIIVESGRAAVCALADPDPGALEAASRLAPDAHCTGSLAALLATPLDGVVIATPSGRHADDTLLALEAGVAVFCQKPLARTAAEARQVVSRARAQDRLLGVDLSYRYLSATAEVANLIRRGELGDVFAVDLTFHNAYGPDKAWYYDRARSGGGCLMDLGIHLLDLLQGWTGPCERVLAATLLSQGRPWSAASQQVEDFAVAQMLSPSGAAARLACSWRAPAGVDAVIEATVFGTRGGARIRNVGGSFYDFVGERLHHGRVEVLTAPPDAWQGRAAVAWVDRLAGGPGFDPDAESLVGLAALIDDVYRMGEGDAAAATPGPGQSSFDIPPP